MTRNTLRRHAGNLALCASLLWSTPAALAAEAAAPFEPVSGQAGKDVVWVPTPGEMVERMLDLAAVTPQDFVIDLGSGDGRNVIAAAKRGARALGVEFNPDMVALSERNAKAAGVAGRAQFVQGDMFEADISRATVMALFLLPDNLRRLTDKFVNLKPGTRIVANTFGIAGWNPDEMTQLGTTCYAWCSAMLYIVPAKVAGTWNLGNARLVLEQNFQELAGTLAEGGRQAPLSEAKLRGERITFTVNGVRHEGTVSGDSMQGKRQDGSSWSARRG